MIPFIYLILSAATILLIISFAIKDGFFKMMSGFFFMILGIEILKNGLDSLNNWLTGAFGLIILAIGAYTALLTIELIDVLKGGDN